MFHPETARLSLNSYPMWYQPLKIWTPSCTLTGLTWHVLPAFRFWESRWEHVVVSRFRGKPVSYKASIAAMRATVHAGGADPTYSNEMVVARLAQFFPSATPVRLPVQMTVPGGGTEAITLEYATCREVIFATSLPLEFGERLQLRNADGTLDVQVVVVALQFHAGRQAVAARFIQPVLNWIVQS